MSEQKPQIIPVQYIPYCEEDEVDLKEIIKKILSYKKFIAIFTLTITFLAGLYAFLKKPVYEIKANIKLGYINILTKNGINKLYLLNPYATSTYIINTYDHSKDDKIKYPQVQSRLLKKSKDILKLSIQDFSNKKALNTLNQILKDLKNQENIKIKSYISNIKKQIVILKTQENSIKEQINKLNKVLLNTQDPNMYQSILNALQNNQDKLLKIKLMINELQEKISPINISTTSIIGKIIQHDKPIKPKKKLIIIIAFVTGFILSIFLVFFIEFIKGLKEENQ